MNANIIFSRVYPKKKISHIFVKPVEDCCKAINDSGTHNVSSICVCMCKLIC